MIDFDLDDPDNRNKVENTSRKPRPFLKRGQGIARFGKVNYPVARRVMENLEEDDAEFVDEVGNKPGSSTSSALPGRATTPVLKITPRPVTATTDSGCEDPNTFSPLPIASRAASSQATSRQSQNESLSDTAQFEAMERALSSDNSSSMDVSTMYKQITKNLPPRKTPAAWQMAPSKNSTASTSVTDSPTSSHNSTDSSNNTTNSSHRHENAVRMVDSPVSGTTQYSNLTNYARNILLPTTNANNKHYDNQQSVPIISAKNKSPLANPAQTRRPPLAPLQPSTEGSNAGRHLQPVWPTVSPINGIPQQRVTAPSVTSSVKSRSPLEVQLILHLQNVLAQLQTDYAKFQEREQALIGELQKQRSEMDRKLMEERDEIRNEREQMETYRDKELTAIKRARDGLNRQRSLVNKKEDEQTKILREQINELHEKVCERDATISSNRAKLRQQETQIQTLTKQLKDKNGELERTTKRFTAAEEANASLRVKLAKAAYTSAPSTAQSAAPTCTLPRSTSVGSKLHNKNTNTVAIATQQSATPKSVRFSLPSSHQQSSSITSSSNNSSTLQSSTLRFIRTDDANTQTSLLMPNHVLDTTDPTPFDAQLLTPNAGLMDAVKIKCERALPDGSRELIYSNGTTEFVGSNGMHRYDYANGDSRVVHADGTQNYYYASKHITQTIEPNGNQIIKFDDGHTEKHLVDGTKEVTRNGSTTVIDRDGLATTEYTDERGQITRQVTHPNGMIVLTFPNGDVETQTAEFVKREFAATGDVKYLFKNGATMTEYANGRVRIRDCDGVYVHDAYGPPSQALIQTVFFEKLRAEQRRFGGNDVSFDDEDPEPPGTPHVSLNVSPVKPTGFDLFDADKVARDMRAQRPDSPRPVAARRAIVVDQPASQHDITTTSLSAATNDNQRKPKSVLEMARQCLSSNAVNRHAYQEIAPSVTDETTITSWKDYPKPKRTGARAYDPLYDRMDPAKVMVVQKQLQKDGSAFTAQPINEAKTAKSNDDRPKKQGSSNSRHHRHLTPGHKRPIMKHMVAVDDMPNPNNCGLQQEELSSAKRPRSQILAKLLQSRVTCTSVEHANLSFGLAEHSFMSDHNASIGASDMHVAMEMTEDPLADLPEPRKQPVVMVDDPEPVREEPVVTEDVMQIENTTEKDDEDENDENELDENNNSMIVNFG